MREELQAQEARHDSVITATDYRPGIIKHIVLFEFRETTTLAQRQEIESRFNDLRTSPRGGVEYILSIESGPQISPEGLHRNFEQGFIVTFRSEGDRNYYVGEPLIKDPDCYDHAHHQFKQFVGQHLEPNGVLVFDFPVRQ